MQTQMIATARPGFWGRLFGKKDPSAEELRIAMEQRVTQRQMEGVYGVTAISEKMAQHGLSTLVNARAYIAAQHQFSLTGKKLVSPDMLRVELKTALASLKAGINVLETAIEEVDAIVDGDR